MLWRCSAGQRLLQPDSEVIGNSVIPARRLKIALARVHPSDWLSLRRVPEVWVAWARASRRSMFESVNKGHPRGDATHEKDDLERGWHGAILVPMKRTVN